MKPNAISVTLSALGLVRTCGSAAALWHRVLLFSRYVVPTPVGFIAKILVGILVIAAISAGLTQHASSE